LVEIVVSETADASGTATTALSKNSTATLGLPNLLGFMAQLQKANPNIDPSTLLSYASQSAFTGSGNTARNGTLTANIAVRVTRELPNGDLYLEGTKVILINAEEYHLYISGLVRPSDIAQDNTVASNRVADAQVEFTGRGDVADQQRKGWFGRAWEVINPF
jgi:flagellar L-ring protein precursor FlgH